MDETLISAGNRRWRPYLGEFLAFRSLFGFFIVRDVQIQFANMSLGLSWLLLRPLLQVMVLALIFGQIARVDTSPTPYLLFLLCGFTGWSYFAGTATKAGNSLVQYTSLISKAYFPRLYLPLTVVVTGLLELCVMLLLLVLLAGIGYDRWPGANLLWLPIPLLLLVLFTASISIWLSALTVDYRDVRLASGFVLQALMFLTPVIWPISMLTSRLGDSADAILPWLAGYPMFGVVEGLRHAVLGLGPVPLSQTLAGFATSLVLLLTGLRYFRNRDHLIADEL